jgi:hypothetical protein
MKGLDTGGAFLGPKATVAYIGHMSADVGTKRMTTLQGRLHAALATTTVFDTPAAERVLSETFWKKRSEAVAPVIRLHAVRPDFET